ncbi:MAG: hypothetical protein WA705_00035 [Candidatus Ozemobacteraceae bacterium]
MRIFRILLILALMVPIAAWSAPFQVTSIDLIKYESGLASSAMKAKPILTLPFGPGDAQVGGEAQDPENRGDGVPSSFRMLADGTFWILDSLNGKLKHFDPSGKLLKAIDFKSHPEKALFRDFAFAPADGFYMLCVTDGSVEITDASGEKINEIEGLQEAREIGVDPTGNVLVRSPMQRGLLRFEQKAVLIEQFEDLDLSVYTDSEGHPYGIHGDDKNVVLYKTIVASPAKEVTLASFPLDVPQDRLASYAARQVLGVDAAQNIYLELSARDLDGVLHLNRFVKVSPDGKVLGKLDKLDSPYMASGLPRFLGISPDGKILGFEISDKAWMITSFTMP